MVVHHRRKSTGIASCLLLLAVLLFLGSSSKWSVNGFRNIRQQQRNHDRYNYDGLNRQHGGKSASSSSSPLPPSSGASSSSTTSLSEESSSSHTRLYGTMKFKNFDYFLESLSMNTTGDGDDAAPPVLLCFTTPMCGPCKLMNKELQHVNSIIKKEKKPQQQPKLFSIDTEKWPQIGSRFEISRLPCLIFLKSGQVMCRMEGVTKAEDVIEQVNKLI